MTVMGRFDCRGCLVENVCIMEIALSGTEEFGLPWRRGAV